MSNYILKGWADRGREIVEAFFRHRIGGALGIVPGKEKITMVFLEQVREGELVPAWHEIFNRQPGQDSVDFAERAALRAKQCLSADTACWLVLDDHDVFYYEKFFPKMPAKALRRAARLDFAVSADWQAPYAWNYTTLEEGHVLIGGILQEILAEKLSLWRQFFPMIGAVCFCGGNGYGVTRNDFGNEPIRLAEAAVWAGLYGMNNSSCQRKCLSFPPEKMFVYRWNWLRCTAALWSAALLGSCVLGIGWWQGMYQTGQELQAAKSSLAMLEDLTALKKEIDANKAVAERKKGIMDGLKVRGNSGQGILVHAGKHMQEGIWLTGLSAQAGHKFVLQGKAMGHGQVSYLMNSLQQDGEFFRGKIFLDSTEVGKDGLVSFRMNGKL